MNAKQVLKKETSDCKNKNGAMDLFVPRYSVSLLYQKGNNIALRVFISNAGYEKEAINEAIRLYSWTMHTYKLVQYVAARVDQTNYGA